MIMEIYNGTPAGFAVPPVVARYGSLLFQERPAHNDDLFSRRHPKMPCQHRAKIFAPFAALEGFDERVRSKDIAYVPRHILDADEMYSLNRTLYALYQATRTGPLARRNHIKASVVHFTVCEDEEHDSFGREGLYHTLTGIVQKVDPVNQVLLIDNHVVPFTNIDSITIRGGADHVK